MSLINQALRKAQRDRTPDHMPAGDAPSGGQSGAPYGGAHTVRGISPVLIIGIVLILAVLIGLVVGLTVVLVKGDTTAESAQAQAFPPSERLTIPDESVREPLAPASPAAAEPIDPQMTPPANAQTADDVATGTVLTQLREAREAAEAKALAETKAAAEAEPAPAAVDTRPDLSQAVIEWLAASKISGVRLAGTNSRVLLNGEGFSVGDTVNLELGLRVLVIQESRILFEDSNGKKYMKRL